jgi:MFS family permease
MFGKLFISCVLATVYSYTSDLFPTPARSAAVGLCSTSGRVGGILAPIIASAVKMRFAKRERDHRTVSSSNFVELFREEMLIRRYLSSFLLVST